MKGSALSARISHGEMVLVSLIAIMALCVRLQPLTRGLSLDEIDTAFYAIQAGSIWTTISSSVSFNNHIGYSLAARLSQDVFGRAEWAFRLPALLYGLASLFLFWIFSRSFLGPAPAALATFLLAQSPAHIVWSTTGRGYSGMLFLTLLSSLFYLRMVRSFSFRAASIHIAASVIAIYTHLFSALVIGVQFLYLVYLSKKQVRSTAHESAPGVPFAQLSLCLMTIAVLSVILYIPALPSLFHDLLVRGRSNFDAAFPWAVLQYLSGSQGALLTAAVLAGSAFGIYSLSKSNQLETGYFIFTLLVPLGIMWVVRPFDLYPRFFFYWLPYCLLFFVAGLLLLWKLAVSQHSEFVRLCFGLAAAALVVAVSCAWSFVWPAWVPHDGFREASRAMIAGASDSAGFCALGGDPEVFQYYVHGPLVLPQSMAEFQGLLQSHPTVKCLYYPAAWQSSAHTEIARFFENQGSSSRIDTVVLFTYPPDR